MVLKTDMERGEMGSVNEIVRREEEDAVALDVDGGESNGFVVGLKTKSQRNFPEEFQVVHCSNPSPLLFTSE